MVSVSITTNDAAPDLDLLRRRPAWRLAPRFEGAQVEEVKRLYAAGWTTERIAEAAGCAAMTVWNTLVRHGVTPRPRGYQWTERRAAR